MPVDKPCVHAAADKIRMCDRPAQERLVGHRAHTHKFGQQSVECGDGRTPVGAMGNHLGNHRVIGNCDVVSGSHPGVDPHRGAHLGCLERHDMTRCGQEITLRVFSVEPCLDRVAGQGYLGLIQWQGRTIGHAQLPFDQIQVGDELGDGMLDLETRIHLHEVEWPVGTVRGCVDNELDGTRA